MKKKEKGITLIALVVTIVILLILASISIGALTGDNGIIDQAHTAKEDTEIASWEEQIDLAIIDAEKKHRNPSLDDVKEELKNKGIINDYSQVDKDGVITTNEPSYEIAGKLDDYVPFGPGKFANKNEEYTDETSKEEYKTVTVPEGFKILEEASKIDDGLVIEDKNGSQFVWIPVNIPISNSEEEGNENKAVAVKIGNNYRGLLYKFTETGSTVKSGCTTATSTEYKYREPDILIDFDNNIAYNNNLFTKESLQIEYNKMIESLVKYKGFYIGRYELGLEGNTPVSKNADTNSSTVITASADNEKTKYWYGLYKKCLEYVVPEVNNSPVVSSMIWGSQYDAMLNWLQEEGEEVVKMPDNINIIGNNTKVTGKEPKDKVKNIYDLYGAHYEWTQEALTTTARITKGGASLNIQPISDSSGPHSNNNSPTTSTRITLYIK